MSCPEGFVDRAAAERAMLMHSDLGGLAPDEGVADLFCGAGGWGEGAKRAGIRVQAAVNHWDRAIFTHARNNVGCAHHLGDAWRAKPRDVMAKAGLDRLGLLMASAACTSHSRAKGSAPVSKRVHMLGYCIARWMEDARPRVAWIENVPEWVEWGPLIQAKVASGHRFAWERVFTPAKRGGLGPKPRVERVGGPSYRTEAGRAWARRQRERGLKVRPVLVQDPARKGQHFKRWWRCCERLGYRMEMRVLDAPDFGGASRRKRLFVQARRDGAPLVWPEKTHGPDTENVDVRRAWSQAAAGTGHRSADVGGGEQGAAQKPLHGPEVRTPAAGAHRRRHRAAAEIIDWSDLGTSIFERPRPLKPKTLARIAEGIRRFVLNDPRPFVLRVSQAGDGWRVWPADEPLPTQTTRQDLAVCTPIIAPQNGGVFGQRVDTPGPTITTKGHQALIAPVLSSAGGSGYAGKVRRIDALLNTVKTDNRQVLVSPLLAATGYGERAGQRPRCQSIGDPLNTVVAQNVKQAVVSPVMVNFRGTSDGAVRRSGSSVGEPLHAITTEGTHHGLVAALLLEYYGNTASARRADGPLGCVTTIHGQEYVIVDILFRMLRPHELAAAMGFPAEYQWPASQRDATRLIGNAVHVDVAAALVGASLPRGRLGMGEGRAVA